MTNYLVVDLDESLIKTDLLLEQMFSFLKGDPRNLAKIFFWLIEGGALKLKNELAMRTQPKVELLPYRTSVLNLIKTEKEQGAKVFLVSASPQKWVELVGNHLNLFDECMGSQDVNLKGIKKYEFISRKYGVEKFKYVGDSSADIEIWKRCGFASLVNPSSTLRKKVGEIAHILSVIEDGNPGLSVFIKQLRIHQWTKNGLLFVPMFAAHKFSLPVFFTGVLAFISLGMAASAVYIFNDLIDVESDRNHQSKKERPLASGAMKIKVAVLVLFVLACGSLSVGAAVGREFLLVVFLYWLLNFFYTFYFKKEIILDIILLSGMYTIRIFLGATAIHVPVSHWLLSFSTLFFFGLACVKRSTELIRSAAKVNLDGRGYSAGDRSIIQTLGVGTGLLSIVVLLLYAMSEDTELLYNKPDRLWMLTPILLYWLGRLWTLLGRDRVHDDPVVFAIKDKVSWFVLMAIVAVLISAM